MIYLAAWLYVIGMAPTYFMIDRHDGPGWSTRMVLATLVLWPLYGTLSSLGIVVALCHHAYQTMWRRV